jgi:hypothetical protein
MHPVFQEKSDVARKGAVGKGGARLNPGRSGAVIEKRADRMARPTLCEDSDPLRDPHLMSSRRPKVTAEDEKTLTALAIGATTSEVHSQAQQDADNGFYDIVERYLTARQWRKLQALNVQADVQERMQHALKMLGLPIPPEVNKPWEPWT